MLFSTQAMEDSSLTDLINEARSKEELFRTIEGARWAEEKKYSDIEFKILIKDGSLIDLTTQAKKTKKLIKQLESARPSAQHDYLVTRAKIRLKKGELSESEYLLFIKDVKESADQIEIKRQNKLLLKAVKKGDHISFFKALKRGADLNHNVRESSVDFLGRRYITEIFDCSLLGCAIINYNKNITCATYIPIIQELLRRGSGPNLFYRFSIDYNKTEASFLVVHVLGEAYFRHRTLGLVFKDSVMSQEECDARYNLVVLLLQYGFDKCKLDDNKSSAYDVDYKGIIKNLPNKPAIDHSFKTWLLLFPQEVEDAFKDCSKEARERLEACKELIRLDREFLDVFINPPKDIDAETLKVLQEQARHNIRQLRAKEALLKKCGSTLKYVVSSQIGYLPAKTKSQLSAKSSKIQSFESEPTESTARYRTFSSAKNINKRTASEMLFEEEQDTKKLKEEEDDSNGPV